MAGARTPIDRRHNIIRVAQFLIAIIILLVGLLVSVGHFYADIFWPLTLGLIVPLLFSEPYFTGPRMAVATALGQVGAYFSSSQQTSPALWKALFFTSIVVAVCAIIAIVRNEKPGQLFHWISTRLGRAIALGSFTSVIILLHIAASSRSDASGMAVVLALVYMVLFLDWARLGLKPSRKLKSLATMTASYAPNQLLVNSYESLDRARRIQVRGPAGSSNGYVVEELASGDGPQYRIVLDAPWRSVANHADDVLTIAPNTDSDGKPRGFAIQGSTENSIRMNPVAGLTLGETLEMRTDSNTLLYQVVGQNLEEETWAGSSAIVERARLLQVGSVSENGQILNRPILPKPYEPLYSASKTTMKLGAGFMRIGRLKGTDIEVGIRTDWHSNNGHLAVLGMSGMGKTTVSAKLANLAGIDDKFVIMDETSEYRTRLGFSVTPPNSLDWKTPGVEVYEPGGEMPITCESVVKGAMAEANAEYAAGNEPRRRFILLEEAHGWLPEWNITSKANADAANRTCRYILQARKFNLTFIMVSQRTAVISKSAISQCENYIILRTLDQTSLDYVEGVIGQELKGLISELSKFEAVCVGPLFNSDAPIVVTLDP